ncbi:MAG TPA: MFS transporter [Trebonia sp.]|jgi:MFS family permease|nr:MFS transporter [Trebonia sp.]
MVGFRDVFALREYRALWSAQLASVAGDQLARVALTVLVYARTNSAFLSAATFVASVIPIFLGGIVLAGLADRFPRRAVMITCDLVRCVLVLVMALPVMPVAALVALLFIVTFAGAPFTAARSALYPEVLSGDRYVLGQTVTITTTQFAQVLGFGVGGAVVGFLGTPTSLVIDAATFAVSALIVRVWVRWRPAPQNAETAGGARSGDAAADARSRPGGAAGGSTGGSTGAVRLVLRTPALLLPMLFGWLAAFYNAPEGVAAPLATSVGGGATTIGVILAAQVFGETAGLLVFGRLVRPAARLRLMGPLAVATCAVLVAFAATPALGGMLAILAVSGVLGAYQLAANAAFVSAVPQARRGAAFGLAQGGISLGQGLVMLAAGAAAGHFAPADVIAVIGAVGAVCALIVALSWARSRDGIPRSV